MVAMLPLLRPFAFAALALLGGCATMSDSPMQQLEVRTVLDYREIGGVGCILSNDAGRWYVIAPGRVTVTRNKGPLSISCKKRDVATAAETVQARLDTGNLVGNLVTTAGIGQFVDRYSGAGYGYPATLTVLMQPAQRRAEAAGADPVATRMF
jgi:hypothetical protein